MITFCIALLLLVAGYFVYGALVEKVFGVNPGRQTPAYASTDGIDYIPMPTWKVFLIQFLNIAGLGPIFGAIMGILYGLRPICGLCSGLYSVELCMIIYRVCFRFVGMELACPS